MKILFVGCVESSFILLNELIDNGAEICGVVTKKESKFNADFSDLTSLCKLNNIEYRFTNNSSDDITIKFIHDKKPDIIYCFGWSYLLSKEIIKIPQLGVVGFHPTKLPYNKGRHPLIWALVLGLDSTASSFFMIDEKADSGDIVSQIDIPIRFEDNAYTLYSKVMQVARKQVIQITNSFSTGSVTFRPQDPNEGNFWRKRTKNDGKIDFRMSSLGIYNLIRGLTKPYIGAHFEFNSKEYKVWSSKIVEVESDKYHNVEPGKIIEIYTPNSFLVKSGDGLIKVIESDDIILKVGDYL